MNYSELVVAVKEDDSERVNSLLEALRPRLLAFLRIHMDASEADAKDCAQDTMIKAIEIIKNERIDNPDQFVSYILSTCKNIYLKMMKKRREKSMDQVSDDYHREPRQLKSLLSAEQKRLLELCLGQLKKEYQNFMQYWFDHPDAHTSSVANHFNISKSNAWTRKHRLIKKLNECYKKKSKL